MELQRRIDAFVRLGEVMRAGRGAAPELDHAIEQAGIVNPWFTSEYVERAIHAISTQWLDTEQLNAWLKDYPSERLQPKKIKRVGVIMAGNIPLVGFHDLLCVLLSGHACLGKFSSKDTHLMRAVVHILLRLEPEFEPLITLTEGHMRQFDAIIATGSDSSSKYFERYFGRYPSIIRKHRNGVAYLTGNEQHADIQQLADDIFSYFGLGCRNVSQLLLPQGFNIVNLLDQFYEWRQVINHNKYANSYDYCRAMMVMNAVEHLDTGYLLVHRSNEIDSPVGVLNYMIYNNIDELKQYLSTNIEKIQCVVGNGGVWPGEIPFGTAQNPALADYADGIDTMNFLINLNNQTIT